MNSARLCKPRLNTASRLKSSASGLKFLPTYDWVEQGQAAGVIDGRQAAGSGSYRKEIDVVHLRALGSFPFVFRIFCSRAEHGFQVGVCSLRAGVFPAYKMLRYHTARKSSRKHDHLCTWTRIKFRCARTCFGCHACRRCCSVAVVEFLRMIPDERKSSRFLTL